MANNKISIVKGEEKDITVTVKDKNENSVDLTGATGFFSVKNNKGDADIDAVITKNTGTSTEMEITNPTGGVAVIHLIESDTNASSFKAKEYFYDVKFKLSNNDIHVVVVDQFVVSEPVTIKSTP